MDDETTLEILTWSARGLTASEVAARLGLEIGEVRCHLARARQELGAGSKLEVVVRCLQRGIIRL